MWLVGPPLTVTSASTRSGVSVTVSAGARSSATRTNGASRSGTPGHRLPEQPGDGPIADVVEVADALGHVAAEVEEHRPERVDRAVDRPRRGLALGDRGSDRLLERWVAGDHRGRLEHLRGPVEQVVEARRSRSSAVAESAAIAAAASASVSTTSGRSAGNRGRGPISATGPAAWPGRRRFLGATDAPPELRVRRC